MFSSSGRTRSKLARSPPTMIVSDPSSARGDDPVTGASSMPTPRSPSTAPMRRVSAGPIVDMSTHRRPGRAASMTPPSPSSTEATCSPSTTMLTTTSLCSATSAGGDSALAPCSAAHAAALPGVWVQTFKGKPARATFAAIREPMIPRPRKPTEPNSGGDSCSAGATLSFSGMSESSSAGGFNAQPLACVQDAGDLRSQRPTVQQIDPGHAGLAAVDAVGCMAAALGYQREGHLSECFQLAHYAVTAAVLSFPTGSVAQGVFDHPQREFALKRLDWRVERVAHRHVHAARPVRVCARALTAAKRLV